MSAKLHVPTSLSNERIENTDRPKREHYCNIAQCNVLESNATGIEEGRRYSTKVHQSKQLKTSWRMENDHQETDATNDVEKNACWWETVNE